MARAWLIYNPAAGRFPAGPLLQRAAKVLLDSGWKVSIRKTTSGRDLPELARQAAERGMDAVFVAGGDGSVGQVAEALAGRQTALAVLPSGTANVWAQELGLPRLSWTHWFALEEAARRLAHGEERMVDLGLCNGRSFLLWAGVGLDGEVVNNIEPRERWEKSLAVAVYATQILWHSLGWEGVHLRVEADGQVWEGRYLIAVASNIRAYAGGFLELAPEAKVDDGLLDFWLVGGESMRDAVTRVLQIFMGWHVEAQGVVHFRAAEAWFHASRPLPLHLDGEPAAGTPPLHFMVKRKALRVLVPKEGWPAVFSGPAETDGSEA